MNRYILEFYNLGICQSCSRVGSTRGTDRFVLGQVRNICTNVGSGPDPRGLGPGILTRPNPTNLYANLTHVNFQWNAINFVLIIPSNPIKFICTNIPETITCIYCLF